MQTDTEYLYSCFGTDPNLQDIVALFVDEMPQRIQTILQQLHSGQWAALRRSIHQLKGSAGSHGFEEISPCAAAVEQAILQGASEDQIRKGVEELVDLCRRVRAGGPPTASDNSANHSTADLACRPC